jgi:hypothetical protein
MVKCVSLKLKRKQVGVVKWYRCIFIVFIRMISASSNNLQKKNQHVITYETLKNRGYNYRMKMNARDLILLMTNIQSDFRYAWYSDIIRFLYRSISMNYCERWEYVLICFYTTGCEFNEKEKKGHAKKKKLKKNQAHHHLLLFINRSVNKIEVL